jgi:hypothetical protein
VWLGIAAVVAERRLRLPATAAVLCVVPVCVWATFSGPLAGRLMRMDRAWLETLATKDYLFPLEWPIWVWAINLGYIAVLLWLFQRRRAAGLLVPREPAMLVGCLALVLVFATALPLNAAGIQLAIQLQPARIFWMLDFLATVYAVWALAEGSNAGDRRARTVAIILFALSAIRGAYIHVFVFPDRPVFSINIPDTDWGRAMAWARTSQIDSYWLADPMHAVYYGSSLRVAGLRDVFVEAVKDQAIGMYDRSVAMRTQERVAALREFNSLTSARARELAETYALDYLICEQRLDLPVAFASGELWVYRLR